MDNQDKSPSTSLSPEQEAAVKMLTSGCSIRYTALVLKLKEATIYGWIARDPAFKSKLKEAAALNTSDEGAEGAKPAGSVELEEIEKLEDLVGE